MSAVPIRPTTSVHIIQEVKDVPLRDAESDLRMSAYVVARDGESSEYLVLHRGDLPLPRDNAVVVRMHSGCVTSEVFGSQRCDCAWQLRHALRHIRQARAGVLIYMPAHEARGQGLVAKLRSFLLMDSGMTSVEAFEAMGISHDNRDYTAAMEILLERGITRIEMITNNPDKIDAARSAGIEVVRRIPSVIDTTDPEIVRYLESKVTQCRHLI
ncbi:MAG: GTP cyclohydrolase II RibA [Nitrososphaera sp.]|nr:GTP cyclohydrolase II RibA [Nitrososphaera sp.]